MREDGTQIQSANAKFDELSFLSSRRKAKQFNLIQNTAEIFSDAKSRIPPLIHRNNNHYHDPQTENQLLQKEQMLSNNCSENIQPAEAILCQPYLNPINSAEAVLPFPLHTISKSSSTSLDRTPESQINDNNSRNVGHQENNDERSPLFSPDIEKQKNSFQQNTVDSTQDDSNINEYSSDNDEDDLLASAPVAVIKHVLRTDSEEDYTALEGMDNGQTSLAAIMQHAMSTTIVEDTPTPATYSEAISGSLSKEWKESMDSEINSIQKNKTWSLVALPKDRKAIGVKWVFKIKNDVNGKPIRFKSRLVVQGFRQKFGFDYNETFAPTAKYSSVRMLLTIAAVNNQSMRYGDVTTAFLHSDIDVEIYIKQPQGYEVPGKEHLALLLHKSLYGLKQAPRMWNKCLDTSLKTIGFKQSIRDPCLYTKTTGSEQTLLIVFVDDIVITSNIIHNYFDQLKQRNIDIKDLGELNHFLGMRIQRNKSKRSVYIDQEVYITKMLEQFRMENCKGADTPLPDYPLTNSMSPSTAEQRLEMLNVPYRQAVGTIMYIAVSTRPDIAKAVSNVSRFLSNPGPMHWKAVKRILEYLKTTKTHRFILGGFTAESLLINAFSDADWAGDLDTRRSTSGYVIFLGTTCISWKSKLQPTVAKSTTEAEYMAISDACDEIRYLIPIANDMGIDTSKAILVNEDNQACIAISKNNINNSRTKHIDIKYHSIREHIENEIIYVKYIKSDENTADIMTKGLSKLLHRKHVAGLGIKPITTMDMDYLCRSPSGSVEILDAKRQYEESGTPEHQFKRRSTKQKMHSKSTSGVNPFSLV